MPEEGVYNIRAMSMPSAAYRKAWGSFTDVTLSDVMRACAAECGLDFRLYGLDPNMRYAFLIRENESCPAFLDRLLRYEGAALKCYDGRLVGIGIAYAQGLMAAHRMEIDADQPGAQYRLHDGRKLQGIEIRTPYASAGAADTKAADAADRPVYAGLPAQTNVQAGRWARGMLLCHNRLAEELTLSTTFNAALTALARVDVESDTPANGEWIVHEAEHDFVNMKTTAVMLRCITSIR
jgi:phage protein D